jgi:hypothetical protein
MKTIPLSARLGVFGIVGLLACADPSTAPDRGPAAELNLVASEITGTGGQYDGDAAVLAGSTCTLGKRGDMKANLKWQVSGDTPVKSFLLWLESDTEGVPDRQLTRKVLGSPRWSGVAAGFEYEKNGPWHRARLELYSGAPDYPAPKTTIVVPCG